MRHIILCGFAMFIAFSSAHAGDFVERPVNLGNSENFENDTNKWVGSYAGVSIGAANVKNSYEIDGLGQLFDNHKTGIVGGGYVGHNWQNDSWVYGIESEFVVGAINTQNTEPFVVKVETNGFVSAKARLGKAFDDLLIYGSIGVAYVFAEHDAIFSVAPFTSFSFDDSHFAPVYGAGLEYAISNDLVLRASYQYLDFDIKHATSQIGMSVLNGHTRTSTMHIASLGIAKRF